MQQYDLVVTKNGPKFKEAAPPAAKKDDDGKQPPAFTPPKMGDDGYPVLGSRLQAVINGRWRLHFPQTTLGNFAVTGTFGQASNRRDGSHRQLPHCSLMGRGRHRPSGRGAPGGAQTPAAPDPGPTLIQAVEEQLGLRLEPKKGMVEFLVVDHGEKIQSEN
jgi:uncharacterized protein (TIGR03435 family)